MIEPYPTRPELVSVEDKLRTLQPAPYRGAVPGDTEVLTSKLRLGGGASSHEGTVLPWRLALAAVFLLAVAGGAFFLNRLRLPLAPDARETQFADDPLDSQSEKSGAVVSGSKSRVIGEADERLHAVNQAQDKFNPMRPKDGAVAGTGDHAADAKN